MGKEQVLEKELNTLKCNHLRKSSPNNLTAGDGFTDPLGFHNSVPLFSWKLPKGTEAQTAYRVVVAGEPDRLPGNADLWDSGKVETGQSVWVSYGGRPLISRQRIFWKVQFWDETGIPSAWSSTACLETGLISSRDWKSKWIYSETASCDEKETVSWLRREFKISEKIKRARLYITARGLFDVYLNGKKAGDDLLTPGWTSYSNRLDTLTYDVTKMLQQGRNAIGARLGMGWYAGHLAWEGKKNFYGDKPQLLLQLEITYTDGSSETVLSDEQWKITTDGPICSSSLYHGEKYDARKEMPGWNTVGFDDSKWNEVKVDSKLGMQKLRPKPFAPVRITEELSVQSITEPQPGVFVFDLGQNMVGKAALNIPVEKEQTVTVRFAEMLKDDGTLYTENYRSAKSIDTYIAAKTGQVSWTPSFTFHGFRYVELSGFSEGTKPSFDWVKGLVHHSDLKRTGAFASSHPKLNRLQSNIVWGQRGNFVDIPTDCPQRDERLGWTGDAQIFCPTSMFNYDCLAFWKSWLRSIRDEQFEDGRIPDVVPGVVEWLQSPGWMDVATFMPWDLYVYSGDIGILDENYEMMTRLIGWYRSKSVNHLITEICGYGDWLQPYAQNSEMEGRKGDTPIALIGTAYYARGVRILTDSARLLGKTDDAKIFEAEADAVTKAFTAQYFDENGCLSNVPQTQTAYLLALEFDLIPSNLRKKAADCLVELVHEADDHLRTGFLGTPYLTKVLDETGYSDLALTVLFKETYPSWFYSINQGATTMWERWNSYSREDGFGDVMMNSFNHYAYGAVGRWMVERIAGLAPDPSTPGYKHFFIRPLIGGPLTSARAELQTPYGRIVSGWKKEKGKLEMEVVVPPNTTATIKFPDGRHIEKIAAGNYGFHLEA